VTPARYPEHPAPEPYSQFDPQEYLEEYYAQLSEENAFLLDFYHETYGRLPAGLSVLELGGGPTIYQLLSASRCAREIVFTDFLEVNRREIQRWLEGAPGVFDWSQYIQRVAGLEKDLDVDALAARLRARIQRVGPCDLTRENPLDPDVQAGFDVVSSAFCLEAVTQDPEDFKSFLRRISALLKPGGSLVAVLVRDSDAYKVGRHFFPACPLNEATLAAALQGNGYRHVRIQTVETSRLHGYTGIMAVVAEKE
jgi:SAM-dependent methyltransferase